MEPMPSSLNVAKIIMQIYGWVLTIIGILGCLVGLFMGILLLIQGTEDSLYGAIVMILSSLIGGGIVIILGILILKAAKAVQERKLWGKIAGVVLAVMTISAFPIGTLASIFIFIGMFSTEQEGWFIY